MRLKFCSLSSCSYANSVVIRDENTCLLIDCGLRKRDIRPFLVRAGLSPGDVNAVLVTHCHIDHVYGLRFLLKVKNIPVFSTAGVLKELTGNYCFENYPSFNILDERVKKKIGGLVVTPFKLSHDVETVGFIVSSNGERMGFITDTGFVPENCLRTFRFLDYLYIESNHDVEMYRRSVKPRHVIRRNLGPNGHLSNDQCSHALRSIGQGNCRLVVLAHLSEDDNEPARALESARQRLAPDIALASAPSRTPGLWSDVLIHEFREHLVPGT